MVATYTDADVIRVIRQNPRIVFQALHEDPELLAEVRRLILTEEVLAMPARLDEVIERQDRTENQLTEVIERQDRTENQLAEVIERQDRTENQLTEVIERQDRTENQLTEVIETQNAMLERQDRMETQIGQLRGAELERRIVQILPGRLNLMYELYRPRVTHGYGVWAGFAEPFMDSVDDAHIASIISDEQLRRIQETDMIVQARRRQDQSHTYIAVEASATIRQSDIVRAKDTADALRAVFEVEAEAVATGYRIRPEDQRRAEEMGVAVVVLEEPQP